MAVSIQITGAFDKNTWLQDVKTLGGIYRGTVLEEDFVLFKMPQNINELIEPEESKATTEKPTEKEEE